MAYKKPDINYQHEFPSDSVSLDVQKFDEFIRSHGVRFVHWRSMRCPVGLIDPDDMRRPNEHHENCSNGFVYTKAGIVTLAFLGNSSDVRWEDAGRMDGSVVTVVLPRFYDEPENVRVEVSSYDRMYLEDEMITVTSWQTFAAHVTGVDRLQFPAVRVVDLMDSQGKRYQQDTDFVVQNGQLHWTGSNRPGVEPSTGKGRVCSVRFTYRPFWLVKNILHEVRLSQAEDEFTGERHLQQMPQSVVLQREYQYLSEQNDPQSPDSSRKKPAPESGGFGPR